MAAPYTYRTRYPQSSDCGRCHTDITTQATVAVRVTPTSNPKRARQTVLCDDCDAQ